MKELRFFDYKENSAISLLYPLSWRSLVKKRKLHKDHG